MKTILGTVLIVCVILVESRKYKGLEFLESCSKSDPELEDCLATAANALAKNFRKGLPQLNYTEVEPIILDELHIALGGGPNGYRAEFRDVTAYGVSAVQITGLRTKITDDEVQLQLSLSIPHINATANYRSRGTLILIQASGAGKYRGEYSGVKAKVFIRAKPYEAQGQQFLRLQQLKMDFSVRDITMGVTTDDGNTIIQAALNLFINSNSQELLKEMKPDVRRKLVQVMSSFIDKIFAHVPYDAFISD